MTSSNELDVLPRTHVTFRIFAAEISPESITSMLRLTPDHFHHLGEYPRSNPQYSAYKHGMWLINSKLSDNQPLEAHLEHLISILEPNKEGIRSLAKNATVDFSCTLYAQNGFEISPEILARMADIGAKFGVTVYP